MIKRVRERLRVRVRVEREKLISGWLVGWGQRVNFDWSISVYLFLDVCKLGLDHRAMRVSQYLEKFCCHHH
ncbi:hypothetical protein DFA_11527 [Cavenderia fasciculata]|uniref:Uncharacterized protein n=1 Tax=Cavenderia fasciculata TaxID=261658 RepID=F4QDD8_CACFS|nr:uncharacterized protein DFA_11527 [Cavenderia fasciculata]EGG13766.1 hypothetical protein DFA_11527 [Cavenderia fasciculata]|eukprot:XP_004350474.1 hypothetical protein DFA_11527 [Cavenderia fasciculata]